jgi:drug/metabolite transporter (DMT)-like permease
MKGNGQGVYAFLTKVARKIPLVGRLREVPGPARLQAFYETLTTTVFATMPFWVLPALGYFMFKPKPDWDEALQRGEGLVYASALLGPLVYVITKRYGRFNLLKGGDTTASNPLSMSFPYGGAFVTITALTCAIAGFAFAIQSSGKGSAPTDQNGMIALSWILIIMSTSIFFLVTAYSNMLDDLVTDKSSKIVEDQPRQEEQFLGDWLESKV